MQNGDAPLPHSEVGERGLISSLMRKPGPTARICAASLATSAFYIHGNQILFEKLIEWDRPDESVDWVWFKSELEKDGVLGEAGGWNYVSDLFEFVPSADNAEFYVDLIMQSYCRRRAIQMAFDLQIAMQDSAISIADKLFSFAENVRQLSAITRRKGSWFDCLELGSCSSNQLETLNDLQPHEKLIDDWCCEADLGFIFAKRGLGKTWLSMLLAHGIATKTDVGPWIIHKQMRVLYLDGEMPAKEIQRRDATMGISTENLIYVNHEILFDRTGKVMNLADPQFQDSILELCKAKGIEALFMDNLSTLTSGVDENKGIDWELIQPWILRLRRARITVIFIHHAGAAGGRMRGHTKKEDPAAWILELADPNDASNAPGAKFLSRFSKWRYSSQKPVSHQWTFTPVTGGTTVEYEEAQPLDVFRRLVELDMNTCTMIALEMGVTNGYVSQLAKKATDQGWLITNKRRQYVLVGDGQ